MNRPRVLLADDHSAVAEALKDLLIGDFDLVGIVGDGLALVHAAAEMTPDVIVADISMPRLDGIDALAELKKWDPNVRVIFTSMYQEPAFVRLAIEAGALGFVLKLRASDELVPAVRAVLDGKTYLSPSIMAGDDGPATLQHGA